MGDHDEGEDLLRLGEDILDRSLDPDDVVDPLNSSSFSETVFLQATQLSNLMKSLQLTSPETASLSIFDVQAIMKRVSILVDSLHFRLRPSPNIGTGSSTFEAYRVMCFALLAAIRNSTPGKSQLQAENLDLHEQIACLQSSSTDCTALLDFLRADLNLPQAAPAAILRELRHRRRMELRQETAGRSAVVDRFDETVSRTSPKRSPAAKALAKKCRQLEDAARAKDLELEQLRAASFDSHDTSKYNDALASLSGEIAQLGSDLAAEAHQRAKLVSIIQHQSAALASAEELAARPQSASAACDHSEIVHVLKNSSDRLFQGSDLGTELASLLGDQRVDSLAKANQVFEVVKGFIDRQSQSAEASTRRLTVYMSNLLSFIGRLANSREMQTWLVEAETDEDFRTIVLGQVGRLEEFLRRNNIAVDTSALCDNFSQFLDVLAALLKDAEPSPRELVLAVQILSLANDLNRKFADRIIRQNGILIADRRELHYELSQQEDAGEEVMRQISEARSALESQLKTERLKTREQDRLLHQTARILKQSSSPDDVISKCLGLLANGITEDEADRSIELLANDLKTATIARDHALSENAELSKKLERQRRSLEKASRDQRVVEQRLDERNRQIQDLQQSCDDLTSEKATLEEKTVELSEAVSFHEEKIRADKDEYQTHLFELERRFQTELRDKEAAHQDQLKQIKARNTEQLRQLRQRSHIKSQALQKKLADQAERMAKLHERLHGVTGDFGQKLSDSRNAEASSQGLIQTLENRVTGLKAELSAAQIDQKMLQLRLSAAGDKLKRERSLAETRCRMAELRLDTAHRSALDEQRAAFDERLGNLLRTIEQKFSDFLYSDAPLTEESVQPVLDRVAESLEQSKTKLSEIGQQLGELTAARTILGVTAGSVVPALTELVKRVAVDWDVWAQRVYALATNDFSLERSPDELKFGLEEAVMSSVRPNRIARRLDVLRTEKKLLLRGKLPVHGCGSSKVSLLAVISALGCIHKLHKIAGRLDGYSLAGGRPTGEATEVMLSQKTFSTGA